MVANFGKALLEGGVCLVHGRVFDDQAEADLRECVVVHDATPLFRAHGRELHPKHRRAHSLAACCATSGAAGVRSVLTGGRNLIGVWLCEPSSAGIILAIEVLGDTVLR